MSRSPHRNRGDGAECWRAILFGEIVRAIDSPVSVNLDPTIRLPRSGRWEMGLARLRPALDDALGSTAFAVAWRWACAERDAHAWPGLPLIAAKATDRSVATQSMTPLAIAGSTSVIGVTGDRVWRLMLPGGPATIGVRAEPTRSWLEVDRIADIVAAWLDAPWSLVEHLPQQAP